MNKRITEFGVATLASAMTLEKNNPQEGKRLGEIAMELLGDYPLYLGGESNITYAEAIALAAVFYGDIEKAYKQHKELESMSLDELKALAHKEPK